MAKNFFHLNQFFRFFCELFGLKMIENDNEFSKIRLGITKNGFERENGEKNFLTGKIYAFLTK